MLYQSYDFKGEISCYRFLNLINKICNDPTCQEFRDKLKDEWTLSIKSNQDPTKGNMILWI